MSHYRMRKATYLLSHEVAELLDISTQTLYNWLRQGKIPEPDRHPVTHYRLWTVRDVQTIRAALIERNGK
jgi:DNA-binding transcriptional MerR regulator